MADNSAARPALVPAEEPTQAARLRIIVEPVQVEITFLSGSAGEITPPGDGLTSTPRSA